MSLQTLFQLCLGSALNLAQQFMRDLLHPKSRTQQFLQMLQQTGGHLGIG